MSTSAIQNLAASFHSLENSIARAKQEIRGTGSAFREALARVRSGSTAATDNTRNSTANSLENSITGTKQEIKATGSAFREALARVRSGNANTAANNLENTKQEIQGAGNAFREALARVRSGSTTAATGTTGNSSADSLSSQPTSATSSTTVTPQSAASDTTTPTSPADSGLITGSSLQSLADLIASVAAAQAMGQTSASAAAQTTAPATSAASSITSATGASSAPATPATLPAKPTTTQTPVEPFPGINHTAVAAARADAGQFIHGLTVYQEDPTSEAWKSRNVTDPTLRDQLDKLPLSRESTLNILSAADPYQAISNIYRSMGTYSTVSNDGNAGAKLISIKDNAGNTLSNISWSPGNSSSPASGEAVRKQLELYGVQTSGGMNWNDLDANLSRLNQTAPTGQFRQSPHAQYQQYGLTTDPLNGKVVGGGSTSAIDYYQATGLMPGPAYVWTPGTGTSA